MTKVEVGLIVRVINNHLKKNGYNIRDIKNNNRESIMKALSIVELLDISNDVTNGKLMLTNILVNTISNILITNNDVNTVINKIESIVSGKCYTSIDILNKRAIIAQCDNIVKMLGESLIDNNYDYYNVVDRIIVLFMLIGITGKEVISLVKIHIGIKPKEVISDASDKQSLSDRKTALDRYAEYMMGY